MLLSLAVFLSNSCLLNNIEKSASLNFSLDSSIRQKVIASSARSFRAADDTGTTSEAATGGADEGTGTGTETGSEDPSQIDIFKDLSIFVDIEVFGDYQNKKSLEITAESETSQKITFTDLSPNLNVYVTGSIYTVLADQKIEFYSGKTESFALHEGVNDITLSLNKLEIQFGNTEGETKGEEEPVTEPEETDSVEENPESTDPADPATDPADPDPSDPDPSEVYDNFVGGTYTPLPAGTSGTAGTSETYVTFGMWPQTIKDDSVTVDTTHTIRNGAFTYCMGDDGEWYYLHTEDLYYESNTTYSNGEAGEEGRESWFKVEPIMWRVISDYDDDGDTSTPGKTLLVAEKVIYSCAINDDNNARGEILANNYKESRMRAFLNGYEYNKQGTQSSEFVSKGFLQTAFDSTLRQMIETVTVRNGVETGAESGYECEDTQDKVFLLTKNEGNDSSMFPDSSLYKHYCTDFALATSISQATSNSSNSEIWLRTPTVQSGSICTARIFSDAIYNSVPSCSIGFFPAICISE